MNIWTWNFITIEAQSQEENCVHVKDSSVGYLCDDTRKKKLLRRVENERAPDKCDFKAVKNWSGPRQRGIKHQVILVGEHWSNFLLYFLVLGEPQSTRRKETLARRMSGHKLSLPFPQPSGGSHLTKDR